MKVTIEGTVEQISETISPVEVNNRARKGESAQARCYQEITTKRKILRRAFDRVRYRPERASEMQKLLNALTGKTGYTESAMKLAEEIIKEFA